MKRLFFITFCLQYIFCNVSVEKIMNFENTSVKAGQTDHRTIKIK